jgi:hypothetical protein
MHVVTHYRGETTPKTIARFIRDSRISRLWELSKKPEGLAIVLAGKRNRDIGGLKRILRFDPKDVLFVDNEHKEGLSYVEREWPGVKTYYGDVLAVLKDVSTPIAFANLDFTGHISDHHLKVLNQLGPLLADGGVVSYTFFRGREQGHESMLQDMLSVPSMRPLPAGQNTDERRPALDERRFIGYAKKIKAALGRNMHPIFLIRYDGRHPDANGASHPMGILAFQKLKPQEATKTWLHEVAKSNYLPQLHRKTKNEVREYLRICSIRLFHEGLRSNAIGEILDTKPTTVAAWLAHETRGTYEEKRR